MAQKKSSKRNNPDDIEKLRKLLDDPCEDSSESTEDKNLQSVKERLTHTKSHRSDSSSLQSTGLEPHVSIHSHDEVHHEVKKEEQSKPVFTESKPLFTEVSEEADSIQPDELFEIEHVKKEMPEFQEVTPALSIDASQETEEESLPSWDVVDDDQPATQTPPLNKEENEEEKKSIDEPIPVWEPVHKQTEEDIIKNEKEPETESPSQIEPSKPPSDAFEITQEPHEEPEKETEIDKEPEPADEQTDEIQSPQEKEIEKNELQPTSFKNVEEEEQVPPFADGKEEPLPLDEEQISPNDQKGEDIESNKMEPAQPIEPEQKSEPVAKEPSKTKPILPFIRKTSKKKPPKKKEEKPIERPVSKEPSQEEIAEEPYEPLMPKEDIYVIYREVHCIDDTTALKLHQKGFTCVEDLEVATVKQLTSSGIEKKKAKQIIKELKDKEKAEKKRKAEETKKAQKAKKLQQKTVAEQSSEWQTPEQETTTVPESQQTYTYQQYSLYRKEIETMDGKKRTIHFFSKSKPDVGEPVPLPEGFEVKINVKTGLPYLVKKK